LAYLNGAPSWAQWEDPWVTAPQYGYTQWIAQSPQSRQLILQVDLIPDSLENTSNPLSWEQSCAAGDFNSYATTMGNNLVAAGLQNSVIRLGPEMNGTWEADYMGSTAQEQSLWATCFDNEVTGLRQAAGANFLIDWNPNACNIPFSTIYPGNAYVDIIGIDAYDASCVSSSTVTFSQLANEPDGLASVEAFAVSQGKPMSLPEWGLFGSVGGDNPGYITGIGSMVAQGDFSFEAFFDAGSQGTLELGSGTPLSTAAFQQSFGNS
jgi:beta-mannanase